MFPARAWTIWTSRLDGRFLIASCEFSALLLKVDVATHKLVGTLSLEKGGMPQDVKTCVRRKGLSTSPI